MADRINLPTPSSIKSIVVLKLSLILASHNFNNLSVPSIGNTIVPSPEHSVHSIVSSAISFSTYKEIVDLTDKCIQMLIEKNYDYQELETTKKILINSLNANRDDARSTIDFIHSNEINNKNYSIKDITGIIARINIDDGSEVMQTYKRRLVYVLRGNENAEN